MYRRRDAIGIIGSSVGLIAGCGAYDFPRQRSLAPTRMTVEQNGCEWVLNVTVEATITGYVASSSGDFHDVKVVAYARNSRLVCEKQIGDIRNDQDVNERQIDVRCSGFPYLITLDATETPCDEDTIIPVAVYSGKYEDIGHQWSFHPRKCGAGLPPPISSRG